MANDLEDRIRVRAQEIWEQEGRPEGKADEHWRRASEELGGSADGAEPDMDTSSSPTGVASTLQPGGTDPSGGQSRVGSIGTGGGSTAGADTGNAKKR